MTDALRLAMSEVPRLHFLATRHALFVIDWYGLSDERREAWRAFLQRGYPSRRIVIV